MKNFIDYIATKEAQKAWIDKLRKLNELPVILYGAGFYAQELTRFLNLIDIEVSDYLVDDEHVDNIAAGDIKPCCMADIESRYEAIHLLIAFCGNPDNAVEKFKTRRLQLIKSIQVIDCRFWERFSVLTPEQVNAKKDQYQNVFEWLQDDLSKKTYIEYVNAKLLYDSSKLQNLLSNRHYFPEDLPIFTPTVSDIFVDAGAFTGDTLDDVITLTGGKGCEQYFAFEPEANNVEQLRTSVRSQNLDFVRIIAKGLWNRPETLRFSSDSGSRSAVCSKGDGEIEVDAIDRFHIPATFIKMDIEGAEYKALLGGEETIRKHRPNLAISLYHKPEDLLQIPFYIKSLCPDYRLYLRIHGYFSEELVLYATAIDKKLAK